jgi:Ca2+-transporting ATPase
MLGSLRTPNPALWWVVGGTLGFLALVLYLPGLREVFGFATLHAPDVLLAFVASAAGIAWFEVFKSVQGRRVAWP